MNILLLGPPGSGKGAQSKLLSEVYNLAVISSSDLLRTITVDNKDFLGKRIKKIMSSGELVDDELMCDLFYRRLKKESKGFILDGFPRNLLQANFLDKMLREMKKKLDVVVEMSISFESIYKRIQGRVICGSCGLVDNLIFMSLNNNDNNICSSCGSDQLIRRCDDTSLEVVEKRYHKYNSAIQCLREYYNKIIIIINAEDSVAMVNSAIKNKLDDLIIS